MQAPIRSDLAAPPSGSNPTCLLALAVMSDVQVLDTASPARCEWVELMPDDPLWQPLKPMYRPYEALTHWALLAHVEQLRRRPAGPCSGKPYDLALSLGDNIDNAQQNELEAFLAIVAGGRTRLSAFGGVQDASGELGTGPWPYWCPDATVPDTWKPRGLPAVPDFVARASAELVSPGLGLAWTSVLGNHDLMRQGTAWPEPRIEAIAVGEAKMLRRPDGLDPRDPLALYVEQPAAFSEGATRRLPALAQRRAVSRQEWIRALLAHGAAGYGPDNLRHESADTVIDTEHVRLVLLDTNHPAGDFEGSVGSAQLKWLDAVLSEVDAQPGRLVLLASHHGALSLTNRRGAVPQRHHAAALVDLLHRHPCVVAWLVGHRHRHRITPHPGPGGGFWEIATASVIDWPSQMRSVELMRHSDGALEIACTLMDHGASAGTLAQLHHALARQCAGAKANDRQGGALDGTVRLALGRRV